MIKYNNYVFYYYILLLLYITIIIIYIIITNFFKKLIYRFIINLACIPTECLLPPIIENTVMNVTFLTVGSNVTYTCLYGYQGFITKICSHLLQWEGNDIICKGYNNIIYMKYKNI